MDIGSNLQATQIVMYAPTFERPNLGLSGVVWASCMWVHPMGRFWWKDKPTGSSPDYDFVIWSTMDLDPFKLFIWSEVTKIRLHLKFIIWSDVTKNRPHLRFWKLLQMQWFTHFVFPDCVFHFLWKPTFTPLVSYGSYDHVFLYCIEILELSICS